MATEPNKSSSEPPVAGGAAAWPLFRSFLAAAGFFWLWLYLVPATLVRQPDWQLDPATFDGYQWVGAALFIVGSVAALSCVWDFGARGRGTPVPLDPPRFLVRNRFYAHVRNPMYLSFGTALIGWALIFPHQRRALLIMLAVMAAVVHLFVVFYEEPTLRRLFGRDYEAYSRHVSRWWPRLSAYRPEAPSPQAATAL